MGTSLSGLTPKDTYPALLKTSDNTALSATLKTISDGSGNDSALSLSTSLIGIGTTTGTARLQVKGSGSTSATASFLVQNSSNTQLLKVRDDNRIELSNTVYVKQASPGGIAVNIQGGPWNGTVGLLVDSTANPIIAQSNLGANSSNPDGASINAKGGANDRFKKYWNFI